MLFFAAFDSAARRPVNVGVASGALSDPVASCGGRQEPLAESCKTRPERLSYFLGPPSHEAPANTRGIVMSLIHCDAPAVGRGNGVALPAVRRPLHRVGAVRRLQGISRRAAARRLNIDVAQVKLQELDTTDMPLSRLYQWQELLEVPVSELLVEASDPLSAPVLKRGQLVRAMKTVLAILEETSQDTVRRMAHTLYDQMIEIMPELRGVGPWHTVGQRRRRDEYGVAAQRRLSDDVFMDLMD